MNKLLRGKILLPLWLAAVVLIYLSLSFDADFFSFRWLIINEKLFFRIFSGLVFLVLFNISVPGWGNFWREFFLHKENEKSLWLIDEAVGIIFLSLLTYFFIVIGLPVKFLAIFLSVGGIILFLRNKVFLLIKDFFQISKKHLIYLFYLPFLFIPFLIALAPPTNYDSLVYHLALPEKYLAAGRIIPVPENIFATFPQNGENLYLLVLSLGKDIFANLIHFNFLLLILALIWLLADYYHLDINLAGLIFISTPAFLLIAGHSFIDLMLVFYVLVAFYCLERWTLMEKFWIYPLIVFLAFIPGIKYTGFIFWSGLIMILVIKLISEKAVVHLWRYIFLIFFFTLVFLLPYLVRNFIFYRNPLAPFFSSVFPGTIPKIIIKNYFSHIRSHGSAIKNFLDIIYLPFEITFQGWKFGGAYDIIGPLYLGLFPGLFFLPGEVLRRRKNLLLFVSLGFLGWLFAGRVLRFLLPVIASGAIVAVLSVEYVFSGRWRKFFYILTGIVLLHNFLLTSWITGFIEPVNGYQDRQKYLTEKINNSYYPAAMWAKKNIPEGKILLFGDARSYYWHRPGLEIIAPTVFNLSYLTERLDKCNNNINEQIKIIRTVADYLYLNYPEGKRLGVNMDWVSIARSKKLLKVLYQEENAEIIQIYGSKND